MSVERWQRQGRVGDTAALVVAGVRGGQSRWWQGTAQVALVWQVVVIRLGGGSVLWLAWRVCGPWQGTSRY